VPGPYNRLVLRAVVGIILIAVQLPVIAASGADARTAVDAFLGRLGDVNVADLVIDQTLTLFRDVHAAGQRVGLAMQSYLYRTPKDVESLLPLAPTAMVPLPYARSTMAPGSTMAKFLCTPYVSQ